MSKKLFISKPLEEVSELVDFCQLNGYELIAESFLSFKAIPFTTESPFDVVFFGSKRAVEFYLQHEKINDKISYKISSKNIHNLFSVNIKKCCKLRTYNFMLK